MENRIFRKTISFDRVFYGFDPEKILRFYFLFKWFPDSNAQREREREHEERLERVRSGSHRWAQITALSPDAPLSSYWRDLAARSRHRARVVKIALGRSSHRDRTVRLSHCPLDQTIFTSISVLPEACRFWTGLVAHDRWTVLDTPRFVIDLRSLSLPPHSLNLTKWFCVLRIVLFWFLFL